MLIVLFHFQSRYLRILLFVSYRVINYYMPKRICFDREPHFIPFTICKQRTVGAAVYISVASCAQLIRRLSPSRFKHVELSRPAQTSAGIPANHESVPRSPRADTLFCIGTYANVYRRIRSHVYTFIHGAICAMQWRRAGRRKRGHLRRLPAHTRAWSINPA